MMIIGCDFHPRFQQISFLLEETGECGQRRLMHTAEAEQYYRSLSGARVRVGIEATGSYGWFRRLLSELGHELVVGDATQIRASNPRRQKTDKRDAEHILGLLVAGSFPCHLAAAGRERTAAATAAASQPPGQVAHAGDEPVGRDSQERRV